MSNVIPDLAQDHPARSTKLPWYRQSLGDDLTPEARELFEHYSGIAPAEIDDHIYKVRDQAWQICPWPCIGEFWFISFGLARHPRYSRLVTFLTAPPSDIPHPRLLDLGTCLGQDLRMLHHHGAPLSCLYGSDLFPAFEGAGHALFRDAGRWDSSHFITGDILTVEDGGPDNPLAKTVGTWDVVNIIMFLHVFSLPAQEVACASILKLLKPSAGAFIIGAQTGSLDAGELVLKPPMCNPGEHKTVYRHSKESFVDMWQRVGAKTGVELSVWAEYDESHLQKERGKFFVGAGERRIMFFVERI